MSFFSRLFGGSFAPRKPRILAVEDDPAVLDLVKDILESDGYEVSTATDGMQGLARYRKEKFDLLILDGRMPRIGGMELLDTIRSLPGGRKQAVIMLSAENMLGPIEKAYELGIVAWIPKPFTAKTLLSKVNGHFKRDSAA